MDIERFSAFLRKTNKSANTIASYCFAARQFAKQFGEFSKKNLLLYKAFLMERFKPKTANIRLLAMNAYATCIKKPTLKVPLVRIQQKPFLELLGLNKAAWLLVDDEQIVCRASGGRVLTQRNTKAGVKIWQSVVLNRPSSSLQHRVDFVAGNLFWVLIRHGSLLCDLF